MSWSTFITVLLTNFVEGLVSITFSLYWKFACENNVSKSITKCSLWILSVLCTARVLQWSFCHIRRTVFANTSMLNLTKSVRVNTRAENSSFACIFSSMALKVLGKLVYFFLSSGKHTDIRSLRIVSEKGITRKKTYYKLALKLQYHLPVFFE